MSHEGKLQFLTTRDYPYESLYRGFGEHGRAAFSDGPIPPTAGLVDPYFNDSTATAAAGVNRERLEESQPMAWFAR